MLFESAHVRVTADYGTATLWLGFPGDPVNALDLARLRELDAAIAAVEANPLVNILVVRSAKPAGFCAGVHPAALASLTTDADRAAFAWAGQQVFARLAGLRAATVAFIDGPCLGAGLELALACDYRLVLSRPTTHLGFPDAPHGIVPGFGGSVRLRQRVGRRVADQLLGGGRTLSGREARALGLVDHAFCDRRGKIELRTFLDTLERRGPRVKRRPELVGFADERRRFAHSLGTASAQATAARQLDALRPFRPATNPAPPFPTVVGLVGDDEDASRFAADAALRGGEVVVCGSGAGVFQGIAVALARGFVTPLEAEQAKARVKVSHSFTGFDRAGLVFVTDGESSQASGRRQPAVPWEKLAGAIGRRCVVAVCADRSARFPRPGRVIEVALDTPSLTLHVRPDADPDAVAALAAWAKAFGYTPTAADAPAVSARAA